MKKKKMAGVGFASADPVKMSKQGKRVGKTGPNANTPGRGPRGGKR